MAILKEWESNSPASGFLVFTSLPLLMSFILLWYAVKSLKCPRSDDFPLPTSALKTSVQLTLDTGLGRNPPMFLQVGLQQY